ncbi:MAG: hypothetical protein EP298_10865 [Gammaproteobacteria bacterium]|nr:MAG: hypothetical protein EP298_10865 [Gammaproteobacteria bacterium]UTW41622.1 hypothetical protein KFE69_08895 [bacterium SCSIO 12844]
MPLITVNQQKIKSIKENQFVVEAKLLNGIYNYMSIYYQEFKYKFKYQNFNSSKNQMLSLLDYLYKINPLIKILKLKNNIEAYIENASENDKHLILNSAKKLLESLVFNIDQYRKLKNVQLENLAFDGCFNEVFTNVNLLVSQCNYDSIFNAFLVSLKEALLTKVSREVWDSLQQDRDNQVKFNKQAFDFDINPYFNSSTKNCDSILIYNLVAQDYGLVPIDIKNSYSGSDNFWLKVGLSNTKKDRKERKLQAKVDVLSKVQSNLNTTVFDPMLEVNSFFAIPPDRWSYESHAQLSLLAGSSKLAYMLYLTGANALEKTESIQSKFNALIIYLLVINGYTNETPKVMLNNNYQANLIETQDGLFIVAEIDDQYLNTSRHVLYSLDEIMLTYANSSDKNALISQMLLHKDNLNETSLEQLCKYAGFIDDQAFKVSMLEKYINDEQQHDQLAYKGLIESVDCVENNQLQSLILKLLRFEQYDQAEACGLFEIIYKKLGLSNNFLIEKSYLDVILEHFYSLDLISIDNIKRLTGLLSSLSSSNYYENLLEKIHFNQNFIDYDTVLKALANSKKIKNIDLLKQWIEAVTNEKVDISSTKVRSLAIICSAKRYLELINSQRQYDVKFLIILGENLIKELMSSDENKLDITEALSDIVSKLYQCIDFKVVQPNMEIASFYSKLLPLHFNDSYYHPNVISFDAQVNLSLIAVANVISLLNYKRVLSYIVNELNESDLTDNIKDKYFIVLNRLIFSFKNYSGAFENDISVKTWMELLIDQLVNADIESFKFLNAHNVSLLFKSGKDRLFQAIDRLPETALVVFLEKISAEINYIKDDDFKRLLVALSNKLIESTLDLKMQVILNKSLLTIFLKQARFVTEHNIDISIRLIVANEPNCETMKLMAKFLDLYRDKIHSKQIELIFDQAKNYLLNDEIYASSPKEVKDLFIAALRGYVEYCNIDDLKSLKGEINKKGEGDYKNLWQNRNIISFGVATSVNQVFAILDSKIDSRDELQPPNPFQANQLQLSKLSYSQELS